MINIFSAWDAVYHPIHAMLRTPGELERMSAAGGEAKLLAGVVTKSAGGSFAPDEQRWIERIERLRDEMNRSTEQLAIADYGARSPFKQLSAEAMYAGRIVTRTVGAVCRSSSKPRKWSHFLFHLIRATKPQHCLELGTCLGISGAYIGAAMQMNGTGTLVTVEGATALALRAKDNFEGLGLTIVTGVTGRFQDTLDEAIGLGGRLDAVFIDGHHDGPATVKYFETVLPAMRPGAVIVFDDIGWSSEMRTAWRTLRTHSGVSVSIDMFEMGVCCVGAPPAQHFTLAV